MSAYQDQLAAMADADLEDEMRFILGLGIDWTFPFEQRLSELELTMAVEDLFADICRRGLGDALWVEALFEEWEANQTEWIRYFMLRRDFATLLLEQLHAEEAPSG